MKITKRVVDAASAADGKPAFFWDTEIKGFGLIVQPSGVKSFVYQYRTVNSRSRRATIGKAGSLTAEEARRKAGEMRTLVQSGGDPLAKKQADREAVTVDKLLDLYLDSHAFAEKAKSTRAVDTGRINRHLRPALRGKMVCDLSPEDVRRAFAAIRDGKTAADVRTGNRGRAIVKGGEGTARMAIRLLRAILRWAISEGMAATNPATDVQIGSDGERDTILQDSGAYARLFRALDDLENKKIIRSSHADAIRVIALTGARRGEIAGLRWAHVNLKDGLIVIPRAQHKTGKKTGKPRTIGLPAVAQAIIAKQPEGDTADFVFRPTKGEGCVNISKTWRVVREAAQLPAEIGLHGLRHSLASHMAMQGAAASEIMTALGHRQLSTAQRYIHWAQDARTALAERAAGVASAGLMQSKQDAPLADVVTPIREGVA